MGRKIEIKMIENATRRQVTYSKRRTSLIKKAHELSVFCDIDVLLLVFSPSRRVSAYCSRTSLEDLLERFISLPTVKKYEKNPNMKNVAEKLERLKGIESIAGDENKLHYLKNRINHLELQAKKFKIDLELLSASIRDFEPPIEEEDPMAQAKLCLRSLKLSLQKLADRKNVLLGNRASFVNGQPSTGDFLGTYDDMRKLTETADEDLLLACNFGGVELGGRRQNRSTTRLIRQLDPWLSPYSNKARERILEGASVKHGNRVNAHSRFPQPVPTFPSIPPPPKYFPAPLQPQSPRVKNNYVLPPRPPPPPYDQAHRQRARDSSFWRQLPMPTDWMTPPPSARYNQQQQHGASEKLFMSYSHRKNGEGSSSQFLTNRNDQTCKNQNNVVGALTSPFQANQGDKVNCFIGDDGNITLPQNINPRIPSLGTNEPLVISSAPSASKNDNSPVVFTVNDDSSNLIGEILSQHQLCINNEYSGEVHKANDNATVDGHVGDFLSQHQPKDNGKSNNNSNEVTEENEKNTSPNIDEFLAIQDFETELISLDALFEEIEKMAGEEAGNQDSGSKEWDGFALAESLNSSNFNIIN